MVKYNQQIFGDPELKRVHFIGIGGMGMSALAAIMLDLGYRVSGSDLSRNLLTDGLSGRGAVISVGHDPAGALSAGAVIYSSAVGEDNPELAAARSRGILIFHRSDLLKRLLDIKRGIAVAGSHGKTSVAAQLSLMLAEADFGPGFAIGGAVFGLEGNGRWGDGDLLVVEADESDGTFRKYNPFMEIITGIDLDHFNFYRSEDELLRAFSAFIGRLDNKGTLVINREAIGLERLTAGCGAVRTYGFSPEADYRAVNLRLCGLAGGEYILEKGGKRLGEIRTPALGRCGIINNLAAAAAALELGADFGSVRASSKTFTGVRRRLEIKIRRPVTVIEDYAHHPVEISAALEAVGGSGEGRIWCVFQPHRYSRLRSLSPQLAAALIKADRLILTDLYPAFEDPIEGIDSELLAGDLARLGVTAPLKKKDEIIPLLTRDLEEGDIVIIMGAGDVGALADDLVKSLREQQ